MRNWSEYQERIFEAVGTIFEDQRDLVILARAGTGKTTTMVEAIIRLCRADDRVRVLTCAFNVKNARDLDEKLQAAGLDWKQAAAKTLNAVGLATVKKAWGSVAVDAKKGRDCAREACRQLPVVAAQVISPEGKIQRLATLVKISLVDSNDIEIIWDVCRRYAISDEDAEVVALGKLAAKAMDLAAEDRVRVDFDDQLWFPHRFGLIPWQYDLVVVDECFVGDTPILLDSSGRSATISELVDTRYSGTVLSYDDRNGDTVEKKVVGWHKRAVRGDLVRVLIRRRGFGKDGRRFSLITERVKFGDRAIVCTSDHRFWTSDGDIRAGKLIPGMTVQIESVSPRDVGYNRRHMHSVVGREVLSMEMLGKNLSGSCGGGHAVDRVDYFPVRGGNGRVPSDAERAILERLGSGWVWNYVISTGGRNIGLPTCYKVDVANPLEKIAIEVDGSSHASRAIREADVRKENFLISRGWTVHRLSNSDVSRFSDDILNERICGCPVEAEVISVEPYDGRDLFVYDITVEDTHRYYAHGVLVHNCQDMNPSQLALARKSVRPGGRLIAIGDDMQSIYAWRAADSGFLERMISEMNARTLILPRTYRCGIAIVAEAKKIVPDYEADVSNPVGIVRSIPASKLTTEVAGGDFVICRKNAPLLPICLELLRNRMPATIQGRDVLGQILGMVDKADAITILELLEWLQSYEHRERVKLLEMDAEEALIDALVDRCACLRILAAEVDTIAELRIRLDELFSDVDDDSRVTLSTAHRAKGLERDRVFLLRSSFRIGGQESNCLYVAITRARTELIYVN